MGRRVVPKEKKKKEKEMQNKKQGEEDHIRVRPASETKSVKPIVNELVMDEDF